MGGVPVRAGRSAGWTVVVAAALGLLVAGLFTTPASAAVTLSRSDATVQAGAGTSVSIRATASSTSCVRADSAPGPGVTTSLGANACGDSDRTIVLTISASAGAPSGSYDVHVDDNESSAVLHLQVQARPATTVPPSTTSTVPAATTTAPPVATTEAPTTSAAPVATTEAPTTTTSPPPVTTPSVAGFTSLASLAAAAPPAHGLFLPLLGKAFVACVPLRKPCADPDFGLIVVPAAGAGLSWVPPGGSVVPEQLTSPALPPLGAAGDGPADAATQSYLLPVLDEPTGGTVKSVTRTFDGSGRFVPALRTGTGLVPSLTGVSLDGVGKTFLVSQPFGTPRAMDVSQLQSPTPALAVFSGGSPHVLYAVVAPAAWGLRGGSVVPLLGGSTLPLFGNAADGSVGLYVPLPDGVQAPAGSGVQTAAPAASTGGGSGGHGALLVLLVLVLVAGGGAAGVVVVRRRRAASALR